MAAIANQRESRKTQHLKDLDRISQEILIKQIRVFTSRRSFDSRDGLEGS